MSANSKQNYIVRSLSKLKHKSWEFYTISRIFHRLNDLDIEFICQQPVFHENNTNVSLLDLYFPQFNICLEINEKYHGTDVQKEKDKEREEKIKEKRIWQVGVKEAKQLRFYKIKTYSDKEMEDKPLHEINLEIERFIKLIRDEKLAQNKHFVAWDFENSFTPEKFIEKGILDIEDCPSFLYQHHALRCFGFQGEVYQRAVWGDHLSLGYKVWFVRIVPHKTWQNSLSEDGITLTEKLLSRNHTEEQKQLKNNRDIQKCVFARSKDELGRTLYRFIGKFEKVQGPFRDEDSKLTWQYQRIATSVLLPKK